MTTPRPRQPDWLVRILHETSHDTPRVNGAPTLPHREPSCEDGRMADKKLIHELIGSITEQGFIVKKRSSTHYGVFTQDGEHVTDLAASPSEHRGLLNTKARLRRNGWNDPKKPHKKKDKRS